MTHLDGGGFSGGLTLDVNSPAVASAGSSIESGASTLSSIAAGLAAAGGLSEPPRTASALDDLSRQWSAGMRGLQSDVEMLGRGVQAAATLYVQTDESAMGPPA